MRKPSLGDQTPWTHLDKPPGHTNRRQPILLYLPILIGYLTFSHPCSFPMLWGEVGKVGLGQCTQRKIKAGSKLWVINKGEVSPSLSLPYVSTSHHIFSPCIATRWSYHFGKLNFIESWPWFHFPLPMEANYGKISDYHNC